MQERTSFTFGSLAAAARLAAWAPVEPPPLGPRDALFARYRRGRAEPWR